MEMRYRAAIFDLDGTLVNSLEDLADSVNEALLAHGYPRHPVEAYRQMVGDGVRMLVERALPREGREASLEEVLRDFKAAYGRRFLLKTRPYPGILPMLQALRERGILLAVCTNKPQDMAAAIVGALFPQGTFRHVLGERALVPRKPAPDAALELARRLSVGAAETAFFGDSQVDMQTAVRAQMLPAGVLWGFRTRGELEENGARVILAHPAELLEKVEFVV